VVSVVPPEPAARLPRPLTTRAGPERSFSSRSARCGQPYGSPLRCWFWAKGTAAAPYLTNGTALHAWLGDLCGGVALHAWLGDLCGGVAGWLWSLRTAPLLASVLQAASINLCAGRGP
jgi:hypothetical protein